MDEEKDLQNLMDKLFDADQLDSPSLNFTSSVIEKIEAQRKEKLTYTPLLPRWVFVVLAFVVVVFSVFVLNTMDFGGWDMNYFESLNVSSNWFTDGISQLNFSTSLGYAVLAFGILIFIQAKVLNKFLDRTNSLA